MSTSLAASVIGRNRREETLKEPLCRQAAFQTARFLPNPPLQQRQQVCRSVLLQGKDVICRQWTCEESQAPAFPWACLKSPVHVRTHPADERLASLACRPTAGSAINAKPGVAGRRDPAMGAKVLSRSHKCFGLAQRDISLSQSCQRHSHASSMTVDMKCVYTSHSLVILHFISKTDKYLWIFNPTCLDAGSMRTA